MEYEYKVLMVSEDDYGDMDKTQEDKTQDAFNEALSAELRAGWELVDERVDCVPVGASPGYVVLKCVLKRERRSRA